MKLKLTAYRIMAPIYSIRVDTRIKPDFGALTIGAVSDLPDEDFDMLACELKDFWELSRAEYPAIYFWIGD